MPRTPSGGPSHTITRVTHWLRRLLLLLLVAVLAAGAWFLWLRPDPIPVTVMAVTRGRVEASVTNSRAGTVKTRRRASLSPQIGGRVAALPVKEGDRVTQGQLLLAIADEDLAAQLDVSRRSLQAAQAAATEACVAADQARRDTARVRQLAADQIVSEDRLEQARSREEGAASACSAARAAAAQARASVALAETTLAKSRVLAPFDGVIAEVRAEVGEFIAPQMPGVFMQPVIDLIDDEDVYVSAPLDEVDVGRVSVGQPVRVTLDPYPDRPLEGAVSRVAPYVEDAQEQSRTFEVEVAFTPPIPGDVVLKPGATADIEVILDAKDDVLRVPSYALLEGDRVLVARDDVLVSVGVVPGLRNWEWIEAVSGLSEGDRVVTSLDRAEVKEGARVVVTESAEP